MKASEPINQTRRWRQVQGWTEGAGDKLLELWYVNGGINSAEGGRQFHANHCNLILWGWGKIWCEWGASLCVSTVRGMYREDSHTFCPCRYYSAQWRWPNNLQKAFQKWYTNCSPLSDTTSNGSLWILNTCCMSISAISLTVAWGAEQGVRMTVLTWEVGRPVTKSRAMYDYCLLGMDRGWRRLVGGWMEDLFWEHTVQVCSCNF